MQSQGMPFPHSRSSLLASALLLASACTAPWPRRAATPPPARCARCERRFIRLVCMYLRLAAVVHEGREFVPTIHQRREYALRQQAAAPASQS